MAGVPVKSADDYLQKLIAEGFKVAVCEQLEDPKDAKKRGPKAVVKRDVVRLITPGTLTEDNLMDVKRANWLLALHPVAGSSGDDAVAMAWADISTGQFHLDTVSQMRLSAELSRLDPAEILIKDEQEDAKTGFENLLKHYSRAITKIDKTLFGKKLADKLACETFNVQSLEGLGHFSEGEWQASAALLSYIHRTQAGSMPPLARPRRDNASQTMIIDTVTRQSLEILRDTHDRARGSLLGAIDKTMTSSGSRLLAMRLTAPLTDVEEIDARLDGVGFFVDALDLRTQIRASLKTCPDMMRALSRLVLNRGGPKDLKVLQKALLTTRNILNCLDGHASPMDRPELVNTLENIFILSAF
jgi:DNA mismatch repair protein MutS